MKKLTFLPLSLTSWGLVCCCVIHPVLSLAQTMTGPQKKASTTNTASSMSTAELQKKISAQAAAELQIKAHSLSAAELKGKVSEQDLVELQKNLSH